jgi:hypothetical protein
VREFVKFQAHPGALAPFFASLLHVLGDWGNWMAEVNPISHWKRSSEPEFLLDLLKKYSEMVLDLSWRCCSPWYGSCFCALAAQQFLWNADTDYFETIQWLPYSPN